MVEHQGWFFVFNREIYCFIEKTDTWVFKIFKWNQTNYIYNDRKFDDLGDFEKFKKHIIFEVKSNIPEEDTFIEIMYDFIYNRSKFLKNKLYIPKPLTLIQYRAEGFDTYKLEDINLLIMIRDYDEDFLNEKREFLVIDNDSLWYYNNSKFKKKIINI